MWFSLQWLYRPLISARIKLLGLIILAAAFSGCAGWVQTFQVGQHESGGYLANVIVASQEETMRRCLSPKALGCAWVVWRKATSRPFVGEVWMVLSSELGLSQQAAYVYAHELCHAVAALQGHSDVCHAEDLGHVPHFTFEKGDPQDDE